MLCKNITNWHCLTISHILHTLNFLTEAPKGVKLVGTKTKIPQITTIILFVGGF